MSKTLEHRCTEGIKIIPQLNTENELLGEIYHQLATLQFRSRDNQETLKASLLNNLEHLKFLLANKGICLPESQQYIPAPKHRLFRRIAELPRNANDATTAQWQHIAALLPAVTQSLEGKLSLPELSPSLRANGNGNGKGHPEGPSTVIYQAPPAASTGQKTEAKFVAPKIDDTYLFDRAALDYWLFFD